MPPTPLTSFVGREHEVAHVSALLRRDDVRLLTLTGPGGVGKTRLALAAAAAAATEFGDGVRFTPLAAIRDHRLVVSAIAQALDIRETTAHGFADQVRSAAGATHALMLLDNFEHLLPAGPLLTELLAVCPRLTLLVTSRERLRLSGERDVPVSPLACPNPESAPSQADLAASPAIQLFLERARDVDPGFALTDANAAAVAAICHRLDGLPLALELAAARSPHLAPAALLARLARRLPLLTGGPRDAPARLRTMRDAIGWSHDLLSAEEQAVFRGLAVFVGGCTLGAAENVASIPDDAGDDIFEDLASLVDASLLRHDPALGEEPRYVMLETVREYGLERLAASGEAADIRGRHAAFFLALAETAEPHLRGPGQIAWLDRLEAELPNLRASLAWLRDTGEAGRGLRLDAALWTSWVVRDRVPEGRQWLESFLAPAPVAPTERLNALLALGDLCERQGDYAAAAAHAEDALGLARAGDDRSAEAAALRGLGNIAIAHAEEALYSRRDEALAIAAFIRARGLLEQSLALARANGDDWGAAKAVHWLATAMYGDLAQQTAYCEEAVASFRRLGDHRQLCNVLWNLGTTAQISGDRTRARSALLESLTLAQRLGYGWHSALCLFALAIVAIADGAHEPAVRLLGAAETLRTATGEPLRPGLQVVHRHAVETATAALGATRFARVWAAGAALSPEEAISEARAGSNPAPGVAPTRAVPNARDTLTPRELDVLRLVIVGRSDRAIADELFISRRTASKHVAAILAKFGAVSRAEAAARAVRAGIA